MKDGCIALARRALWKIVCRIRDERKSIEQLFDGRGDAEDAARSGLLRSSPWRRIRVLLLL